jgi:hypothetical protein
MENGKRLLRRVYPRRVKQRTIFNRSPNATLEGFEAMWLTDAEGDLTEASSLFANDAFIRNEYVEIYDLIRERFAKNVEGTALIRGSSGVGKSAFLQYLVARIRNETEAKNVLIVRGDADDSRNRLFLYLSTNWFGWKTATAIPTREKAKMIEKYCDWTIVDGCDWEPVSNFTVGAASPSTAWKGFRLRNDLIQICMPPWSFQQLERCRSLTTSMNEIDQCTLQENYSLVGGIARWALAKTDSVLSNVNSAVTGINFSIVQQVMATQHATKNDEKELVHRLILWTIAKDDNGGWVYEISPANEIHYSLLTDFVAKELSKKAALLSLEKRKSLISELQGDGAASAYRGVIFEADAIDRLVRGGTFTLRKCSSTDHHAVQFKVSNTLARFPMKELESLNVEDAIDRIVVPDARNFESVDAFRVSSSHIFHTDASKVPPQQEALLFQMTVGRSHPTKYNGVKTLMEKIRKEPAGEDASCAVVFVVPGDVQTFYTSPQAVINKDGTVRKRNERDFNSGNQYYIVIEYE